MSEVSEIGLETELNQKKNTFFEVDFNNSDFLTLYGKRNRVYEDYAKAIQRRDREPLDKESFLKHFFEGGNFQKAKFYGGLNDGYLLGSDIEGVFIPTHFAPNSLRGGYILLKDLIDSEVPVALFLTSDLVDTIKKMKGWRILPVKMKTQFRGQEVEKTMVVNKFDAVFKLAKDQLQRKIAEFSAKAQEFMKNITTKKHQIQDIEEYLEDSEAKMRTFEPEED